MEKQEKVGFLQKKEDLEQFLGRKHWKTSSLAEAGKDKASTLTKKVGKRNSTFSVLYVQFLHLFSKKVDEYNFTSIFMFSSGRQFFSSRFSFFTSSYNFEVNLHEKVGQKIEKACWATYGEGKLVRKKNSKKTGIFFTNNLVKKIPVYLEFFYELIRKENSSFFGIFFTSQFFPTPYLECRIFP